MPIFMLVKCRWAMLHALKCGKSTQRTIVYVLLPLFVRGICADMESKTANNYTELIRVVYQSTGYPTLVTVLAYH